MQCECCDCKLTDKTVIKCPRLECGSIACKECTLQNLDVLHKEHKDLMCIHRCGEVFGRAYLMETIPSFRKIYTAMQKDNLKRAQDARVPSSLEFLAPFKRLRAEEERTPILVADRTAAKRAHEEATKQLALSTNRIEDFRVAAGIKESTHGPVSECDNCHDIVTNEVHCPHCEKPTKIYRAAAVPAPAPAPVVAPKIVCRCPFDKCVGYILDTGTCPVCNTTACLACNEISQEGHRCDPAIVLSIAAMKADTKLCPNLACLSPVHRISGCKDMWCVVCGTFFDWNTREITKETHNPEHIKFKTALGNIGINSSDQTCAANVVFAANIRSRFIGAKIFTKDSATVIAVAFLVEAMQVRRTKDAYKVEAAQFLNADTHRELRMDFMIGKITEEEFKDMLHRREKNTEYISEIQAISNTFIVVATELIIHKTMSECATIAKSLEALIAQYNIAVDALAVIFNVKSKRIAIVYNHPVVEFDPPVPGWGKNNSKYDCCFSECTGGYV